MKNILNFKRKKKQNKRILGYNELKITNNIGLLRRIQSDLTECHFDYINCLASDIIFNASIPKAELITRQLLLQRHAGLLLNDALLYSIGNKSAVAYPLPKEWREILIKHGFQIDIIKSSFAWLGSIILYLGYGILFIAYIAVTSVWSVLRNRLEKKGRYAYFENLTQANLPQPGSDGRSHDIISWYASWEGRSKNLSCVCHGVRDCNPCFLGNIKVEYSTPPFHKVKDIAGVKKFVRWGIKAIALSVVDVLRGRWWHAILLAESAKAKMVQLSDPKSLAVDYLFHYSGTIYRPMWTYEAEKRGSRIFCYFYSTSEQVKLSSGYESQRFEWGAASWPQYLVWDEYQAEIIRRDIDLNASIRVVGPIWFSDSSDELPGIPERSIAVFDIQPQSEYYYCCFTTLAEYRVHNPKLHIDFLNDIKKVAEESDVKMVFKRKREIDKKRTVKEYADLVNKFSESNAVIMINPSISPIKVIEKCKGIISMPFTSTALYLRDQGIPSIYYDPTGWIQKDDRGAHGIPIVSGIEELRSWFLSIFKNNI